jgi:RNAse (barnase) inhibitor barstar
MKTNRMVDIGGKTIKASKVPEVKRKLIKKSSKLKCQYIVHAIHYKGIPMRAYWIRMNGQSSWKMLVGTDKKLTFLKAMEYYQVRWSIEVFFKECKQNLKLGKCHSNDFDALIASITTAFMNYMALALKKRFDAYETLGALFRGFKEDMLEMTLVQKMWQILRIVFNSCLAVMDVCWDSFMRNMIENQEDIQNQLEKTLSSLFSINKAVGLKS